MATNRLLRPLGLGLGVAVLLLAAGCGEPKGNVSGQVRYEGKPLPDGKITFLCEGGSKPVVSAHIQDGKYEVKGAAAGPVKITVATYPPGQQVAPPPGMGGMKPPERQPPAPAPRPDSYWPIPRRYSQFDQSNLDYIVKPGHQVHDIDLTP
jgi:hypothetical protein